MMNNNQRYFVEEFAEEYLAGRMTRRDLLHRVLLITGGTAAAATALLALGCGTKSGQQPATSGSSAPQASTTARTLGTPPAPPTVVGLATMPPGAQTSDLVVKTDDPAVRAEKVQFPGQAGTIFGYLARPKSGSAVPGIIITPNNIGVVEPNPDIARRYAKEGFAALVVDTISREGGTEKFQNDPAQIAAAFSRIPLPDVVTDLQAALVYLKTVDGVRKDRLGVTGFCIGGNHAFALAVTSPEIIAAVPYYGTSKPEDLAKSKAAFLCFYGELDTRVTSTAQATEQALKAAGRPVEIHIEPGAAHGFFQNSGAAYNVAAARDAWPRTIAWFTQYLKNA
jgi:carboxymethylenebutenolidase